MLSITPIDFEKLFLACAVLSGIDFAGFNFVTYTLLKPYRYWHMLQYPMLAATGVFLLFTSGITTALSFALWHWCFVNDWLFYCLCAAFNLKNGWENWDTVIDIFTGTTIAHSKWTLGYLVFKKSSPRFVYLQAVTAIVIVIIANIFILHF